MAEANKPRFDNTAVWLMLLKEGGRWTVADVADRLGMHRTDCAHSLKAMHQFGTLQRWEATGEEKLRYGVTQACKVPRGITVQQILACDLAATEAA